MKFYATKYKQLDLGLLRSSLDELDKTNRWVALGNLLPWTELEKEYNSRLDNQKKGAGNKPARMILGAMIIKHKLNLSDAETIEIIRESPYMQYFCGLHEFTDKPIFDPSLFVTIRKRISEEELNKMTVKLLNKQKRLLEEKRKREEEEAKKNDEEPPTPAPDDPNAASFTDSKGREHKGVLKIDATCADAEMRYPVDVDIIHDGCRKVTDYIIKVCEMFELHKPRTNYKHAREVAYYHHEKDLDEDLDVVTVGFKSGKEIDMDLKLDEEVYPDDNLVTAIDMVQYSHFWHDNEDSTPDIK